MTVLKVRARIVLVSGVMIAASGILGAQTTPPRVRLTEDLRLDATQEDFPTVSRFYVGPGREIIVPINQDMHLRVFDSTGRRVATIGRRGSGPGEFQAMSSVGWTGDTLWVHDSRQARLSYFARDGRLIRTALVPTQLAQGPPLISGAPSMYSSLSLLSAYGDGSVAVLADAFPRSDTGPRGWGERVLLRIGGTGSARLIARPPTHYDDRWFIEVSNYGRPIPFTLFPQLNISADGSRFATMVVDRLVREGGTFSVTLFRPNSDTVFHRSHPYSGVPIPQLVIDSALAAIAEPASAGHAGPPNLPQQFQALARRRMPDVYAPVQSVLVGVDNTVWVGFRPDERGNVTLILNGRGDQIGAVHTLPNTRIRQASATHVWVTETDSDGLSSIVRYRISGLACGVECR